MKLTDQAKNDILSCGLKIIKNISNKAYQTRIWIRGEGPEVDDFDDTVCVFFDMIDTIIKNYKDFGLNEFQFNLLNQLRVEFEKFADENDFPQEFIDTPDWNRITEMAKEVVKVFNYQKSS